MVGVREAVPHEQCLVAGFDTVRSIVAARAWSALAARFALTNSGRYRLQLPATSIVATIHRTDRSFRLRKPPTEFPPPEALGGFPHWGTASLLCRGGRGLSNPAATRTQKWTPVKGVRFLWSKWRDSNPRPFGPEPNALPNCATPRYVSR